jgi:uncharacterized SAM-binding protein YcdF (DUF218 family)
MSAFYILSKIFAFFLYPAHWIYFLLVWIVLTKKPTRRKRLVITTIVIFLMFSNQAILNLAVNSWQPEPVVLDSSMKYNAGIILGGLVVVDKYHRGYMWQASDRFIQAVKLYKTGVIKKIAVTGGSLFYEKPKEADFIKEELIKCGIPAGDIYIEDQSANTYENAVFIKRVLDSVHIGPPYVLITSAMHIKRAEMVFKKAGMQVVAYPSNYEVVKENLTPDDFIFPKLEVMDVWRRFLKEITGIWAYKLVGKA